MNNSNLRIQNTHTWARENDARKGSRLLQIQGASLQARIVTQPRAIVQVPRDNVLKVGLVGRLELAGEQAPVCR
jgi:hypothetical protein